MHGANTKVVRGTNPRQERIRRAGELADLGLDNQAIGRKLGVRTDTARKYVALARGVVHSDYEVRGPTMRCGHCGRRRPNCTRFRRAWWCPECLTTDEQPVTIENYDGVRHNERMGW